MSLNSDKVNCSIEKLNKSKTNVNEALLNIGYPVFSGARTVLSILKRQTLSGSRNLQWFPAPYLKTAENDLVIFSI